MLQTAKLLLNQADELVKKAEKYASNNRLEAKTKGDRPGYTPGSSDNNSIYITRSIALNFLDCRTD